MSRALLVCIALSQPWPFVIYEGSHNISILGCDDSVAEELAIADVETKISMLQHEYRTSVKQ